MIRALRITVTPDIVPGRPVGFVVEIVGSGFG
jgi:hypothetical protein